MSTTINEAQNITITCTTDLFRLPTPTGRYQAHRMVERGQGFALSYGGDPIYYVPKGDNRWTAYTIDFLAGRHTALDMDLTDALVRRDIGFWEPA